MKTNVESTDAHIIRHIHSLHHKLISVAKPYMLSHNLSPPRFQVLAFVVRNQPVHMSALRPTLHVTTSTLTSLVDGLESDGLVERYRGVEDRRKVFLRITEHGKKLLTEIKNRMESALGKALQSLGDEERQQLRLSLEKINISISDTTKQGRCDTWGH